MWWNIQFYEYVSINVMEPYLSLIKKELVLAINYLRVLSFSHNLELQEDPRNVITFILQEPKLENGHSFKSLLPVQRL